MMDTHCHVQFNAFKDDSAEVIKKCADKKIILNTVGSQLDTSRRAVKFAESFDGVYATVGLHPIHLCSTEIDEEEIQFKSREEKFDIDIYRELAKHKKTIAIGECGLDFYHLPINMSRDEAFVLQKEAFIKQIELAQELSLPVVIHVRSAYQETIKILEELPYKIRGVVHCYSSNWRNAEKFLSLGLHLGFTATITFPAKKTDPQIQADLIETVQNCPLERILTETDAPYLAPQAYRGQRCEPWMVEEVVKKIAEIKKISYDKVNEITFANALKLFNIK
ncbi:MAG: hydrolase TatD [Candidatus Magasanikbacteria bacterium CG10_big_fil_rev_8_21_14_0_10_36_32]|uniref:Hydrolase TatD n=1 Tax=Candidatus Magasanikbacteria bacterium CG10_big_fil_rev_8_21_14_0_10_36_32 TaxID=1974646 RepID=A0A2M6W7N6_9BACT|nr:MAG: hydrolase TatD [Candidatus Magasanikbacteria bacterium CG10_big_fil_rev_8_21_14_0_10_36_32]